MSAGIRNDCPLVSIIIPTLNEAAAIPICLASVREQKYEAIELIVVDSGSTDGTREEAIKTGANLLDYQGKPLGARYYGLQHSQGDLILLLDADQVLFPDTVARAANAMVDVDMLVLQEHSYHPKGYLQRCIARQREALQKEGGLGIPPHCYPRVYRRALLQSAFAAFPPEVLGSVFTYDDRILYAQALAHSQKVGILARGVMHIEEDSWLDMMRHAYRQGKCASGIDNLALGDLARAPESSFTLFQRAVKNGYLPYALLKELSFRLGRKFG
ncbi:MAG: glycosyltransferase [Methanomassiliicoccales archaeon]